MDEGWARPEWRQRVTSLEYVRDRRRGSPLKEIPDPIMQKLTELEHKISAATQANELAIVLKSLFTLEIDGRSD